MVSTWLRGFEEIDASVLEALPPEIRAEVGQMLLSPVVEGGPFKGSNTGEIRLKLGDLLGFPGFLEGFCWDFMGMNGGLAHNFNGM
jgi:hypothetical protein